MEQGEVLHARKVERKKYDIVVIGGGSRGSLRLGCSGAFGQ